MLDIGCYVGWNSAFFKHYSTEAHYVVGCDLDTSSLRKAQVLLDDVVRADIRHLPFKTTSFDDGLCIEVIEHLPKDDAPLLVEEFKRVCSHVFLTTPNCWQGRGLEALLGNHPLLEHQSQFSPDDLRALGATKVRGLGWKSNRAIVSRWGHFLWFIPYIFPRISRNLIVLF